VVLAFAFIGEVLQPKSFSGIFGSAPSVALATLGLTFVMHGGSYAALEGRSMVVGAVALLMYSLLSGWVLLGRRIPSMVATGTTLLVWFVIALGVWAVGLR
jgi:hypothetical protein